MVNDFKDLRAVAYSNGDYTKSVGENIATDYQYLIDETFEYAPNLKTIQEQENVGGSTYKNLKARVCKALNNATGENIGDQYRKIIFKNYNYPRELGYMYKFDGRTWLTTNLNTHINQSGHSIVRMCNNVLKWVDKIDNTTVNSWDCVFVPQIKNTDFDEGTKDVVQVGADIQILVQRNAKTNQITYNDRFIFDSQAFLVVQVNNHISPTYLTLKMKQTQILPTDDLVNNIAGAQNLPPISNSIKILPSVVNIVVGDTQTYSVFNYVNSIATTNTFSISASGLDSSYYILTQTDGNRFSIKALKAGAEYLRVQCVDNVTNVAQSISILFTAGW